MPINPLISWLLWAAYLVCLLLSGVQSPSPGYPVTAVTANVARTTTTTATYYGADQYSYIYGYPPIPTPQLTGVDRVYPFVNSESVSKTIRLFDTSMNLKLVIAINEYGFSGFA